MRGILAERGIVFAQSITRARREIPVIIADINNSLTRLGQRDAGGTLMDQLRELDKRITAFDERIDARLQIQCYLPTHCPRSRA